MNDEASMPSILFSTKTASSLNSKDLPLLGRSLMSGSTKEENSRLKVPPKQL